MASHGSLWGGGDGDVAVLRVPVDASNEGAEGKEWNLQGRYQPFYRFPSYVNDLPPLSAYTDALDRQDGALDGKWRDNSIAQLEEGWATPARIPYQGRMVEEVIEREGFGADDTPEAILGAFVPQFYEVAALVPPLLIAQVTPTDAEALTDWLRARRGGAVQIVTPRRGDRKQLVEMVAKSAAENLEQSRVRWLSDEQKAVAAMTELQTALDLPR